MRSRSSARSYGSVFNEIAGEYERHRPAYPDALVREACQAAGVGAGAAVLEVGCGTGQLTRSLLVRGLRVTAVEPGDRLIAQARHQLGDVGDVQFVNGRLEDVSLPQAHYRAVFSGSAIHWVDPDVGWRKTAETLVDGGTLALLSYFGLDDPRSAEDQHALRIALAGIAPELADGWPTYRDLTTTLAGVASRRENVSEAWSWLGSYDLARGYAAALYEDVQLAVVPMLLEHTGDALNALLSTMSFWTRLSPRQQEALSAANRTVHRRLGRAIRSSTIACLLTARRRSRARATG